MAQNNQLKSLLGPIYYQNTRLFKRKADKKPEYKHYPEIEPSVKYIKDVMVDDLQEIYCYYKNEYITPDLMELLKPDILIEDLKKRSLN